MFRVAPSSLLSRRAFIAGSAALIAGTAVTPAFARSVSSFVDDVWKAAKARGVPHKIFEAAMGDFVPLDAVMALTQKQPESTSTAGEYVTKRVSDKRIATGRDMRGEWAKTLGTVARRYGVQPEAVLAIWGLETNFGANMGDTNTVHALATLTYGGYRSDYFRDELLTALQILAAGNVKPVDMIGSWAGAMGHPQFMPSSFMKYAVDFKGDGKKDIWNSIPDAQASTANYLRGYGWQPGETWGYEVTLPKGFDYAQVWTETHRSLGHWAGQGVTRANGKAFPRGGDTARLLMPMGGHGPVFAVLANFDVIKKYNNSDLYALSVGHLADRIIGGKEFAAAWPDDTKLQSDGRAEVQKLLASKGYAVGKPDGVFGAKTRAALIDWQKKAGLLPDGYAGGNLLHALSS